MNLERMKQWVKALRSGDYLQTAGTLRDSTGFCCLGVIQDLYVKDGKGHWEPEKAGTNRKQRFVCEEYGAVTGSYVGLVRPIQNDLFGYRFERQCDLLNSNMKLPFLPDREGNTVSLAELNDKGLTFDQIADVIEWYFIRPEEETRRNVVLSQYNIM